MRKASIAPSAVTDPPTSRKLAGSAPCSLMMSMVAIARPGAVHQAADGAVQRDVVEIGLVGTHVERALLRFIGHRVDVGMAEERVVVEIELGIDGQELPILRDDQRIDFRQRRVGLEERPSRGSSSV